MNKFDLAKKINDLLILKQDDDAYHLFGQYVIIRNSSGIYQVRELRNSDNKDVYFTQLKHAVTWCVFHKNKKYKDLPIIADLDETLSGLQVAISNLKRLCEKADKESQNIYLAKLIEDKVKRKAAQRAMNDYIDTSKYWQKKTFAENKTL